MCRRRRAQWPCCRDCARPSRAQVEVFEAEPTPGGGVRTMELTLPGFDTISGRQCIPGRSARRSFLRCRCAIMDWNGFIRPRLLLILWTMEPRWSWSVIWTTPKRALGLDGKAWRAAGGAVGRALAGIRPPELRQPTHVFSRHPLLMARFGLNAFRSAGHRSPIVFARSERERCSPDWLPILFLSLDDR